MPNNWKPATQAQSKALECTADLLLFGGAAGSLKSETLLVDAVQEFDNPHLKGVLFRRTYPELTQLINRSRELYSNLGGTFNESKNIWRWPWGATMQFAYCKRDEDVYPHQGQEYSWVGWDESTHHSEFEIRYLLSRLRSTDPSLWQRCRLSTNPGGEGHSWHQHMFLGGVCPHCQPPVRHPDVIYKDAVWPSDKKPINMSTAFIFGKVKDHDLLGKDYISRLETQSGSTAKALLDGCWQAFEGQYYDIWEPNRSEKPMVMPRQSIGDQYYWPHWIAADYGFSGSQASAYLFASGMDGTVYCLQEYCAKHVDVKTWAREVYEHFAKTREGIQPRHIVGMYLSPDMWNDRGDNHTLADQMNEVLFKHGMEFTQANNDRAGGAMLIYTMLQTGKLVVADTCKELIEAIPTRLHDEKEPEKVRKVIGDPLDDCYDGFRYGIYSHELAGKKPAAVRLQEAADKFEPDDVTSRMIAMKKEEAKIYEEEHPPIFGGSTRSRLRDLARRRR